MANKTIITLLNPKPGSEQVKQIIASAKSKGFPIVTGNPQCLYIFIPDADNIDVNTGIMKGSLIEQTMEEGSQSVNIGNDIINLLTNHARAQASGKPAATKPAKAKEGQADSDGVDWNTLNNLPHMKEVLQLFPKHEDKEGSDLVTLSNYPNVKRLLESI